MIYTVDVPNPGRAEWLGVAVFTTREEAIAFAQTTFGADEEGRVSLVSGPHCIDEEEDETDE